MSFFRRGARAHPPISLRLLSRPGCHLCDDMRVRLAPVLEQTGVPLTMVDVDSDPELRERWGNEIPVLLDEEGSVVAKARDTEAKIRQRLLSR
ncbi:MAG: glutaredoxin family protein [Thermoanaerobaculia bacterium]